MNNWIKRLFKKELPQVKEKSWVQQNLERPIVNYSECPCCNGRGTVSPSEFISKPPYHYDPWDGNNVFGMKCPKCNGYGTIKDKNGQIKLKLRE